MTLNDFPILIHVTDTDLRTTANGGEVTDAGGDDIAFGALDTGACDGLSGCALYFEVEKYVPTTGELVAWVQIPGLNTRAAASDTVIYIYYGNSDITSPLESPEDVWDSNFKGVWHLHDDFLDSTSSSNDGTNNGSTDTTGLAADGQDFDGSNDYVQTTSGELETADDFTLSAWFNSDDMTFARHIVWQGISTGNGYGDASDEEEMSISMGGYDGGENDDVVAFHLGEDNSGDTNTLYVESALTDTTNFHHVVAVVQNMGSSPEVELFLDGVSVGTDTGGTGSTGRTTWDTDLRFGRPGASTRYFNGILDEVRISTVARDDDWVATEYQTMDDPGDIGSPGFYTVGSEEADPPTAVRDLKGKAELGSDRVEIRWVTDSEIDNLGFWIFRERGQALTRLNPTLIPGSALQIGRARLSSGGEYRWTDPSGRMNDRYWVDSVDVDGTTRRHGPITVIRTSPQTSASARSGPTAAASARSRSTVSLTRTERGVPFIADADEIRPIDRQFQLAQSNAVKIYARETGWHRVAAAELYEAGLSSSVDPDRLQLYTSGIQVPLVVRGFDSSTGDMTGEIEFWGDGNPTAWSDTRVYWLVEGQRPGVRVSTRAKKQESGVRSPVSQIRHRVLVEDRLVYFPSLLNGDAENFFGRTVAPTPIEIELATPDSAPAVGEPNRIEVRLQGVTDAPHSVRVRLNQQELGVIAFEGREQAMGSFQLSDSTVLNEVNSLYLLAEASAEDYSFVDSIEIEYSRRLIAREETLRFRSRGPGRYEIAGITSDSIAVLDVTDPHAPIWIPSRVVFTGARGGVILFQVDEQGPRDIAVFNRDQPIKPPRIDSNQPSSWHEGRSLRKGSADSNVLAVYHRSLFPSVERWREFRSSEGWQISLIEIDDLYDEFNFGHKSPHALRSFFERLHRSGELKHVVLFGDASFDPRGYLSDATLDRVPTWLLPTERLETAADDHFVDFDNDGLPEWPIGRIPAYTNEQAVIMVDKVIEYSTQRARAKGLLVADSGDGVFDFESIAGELAALVPAAVPFELFSRSQSSSPTEELLFALSRGVTLVNYVGHGSRRSWGGSLLRDLDVGGLMNRAAPALYLSMACLSGYFHDPASHSISEALLYLPGGGAVAVWASSGMTRIRDQKRINAVLLETLFGPESITLGEAILRAKRTIEDRDVIRSWNLLGDPLLRLPRP